MHHHGHNAFREAFVRAHGDDAYERFATQFGAGAQTANPEQTAREHAAVNDVFDMLERYFGNRVPAIVPCIVGTKKPRVKFKGRCNLENLTDDEVGFNKQAILVGGNLAAKMGQESHGLCCVDIDVDARVEPYLKERPEFRKTLRIRAKKGEKLFFYARGAYPPTVLPISVNGERIGEFRGGGNALTMIWGGAPGGHEVRTGGRGGAHRLCLCGPRVADGLVPEGTRRRSCPRPGKARPPRPRRHRLGRPERMPGQPRRGVLEALVVEYFPDAQETETEYRCAGLTGRAPRNQGSFAIAKSGGWARDWDGSYPGTGIIQAITSEARATATGEPRIPRSTVLSVIR